MKAAMPFLSLLLLAAIAPLSAQAPTPSWLSVVGRISERARAASDVDALLAMLAEDSIPATRTSSTSIEAPLSHTLRARDVARAMGMAQGCIVSTDVHQTSWSLFDCAASGDSDDRLLFRAIGAGIWDVVPHVDGRPAGHLPTERAGASPAYAVARYQARVIAIEVRVR
jgi:hypothetical protein